MNCSNSRTQGWELAIWFTSQQWMCSKETLQLFSLANSGSKKLDSAQEFPAQRRKVATLETTAGRTCPLEEELHLVSWLWRRNWPCRRDLDLRQWWGGAARPWQDSLVTHISYLLFTRQTCTFMDLSVHLPNVAILKKIPALCFSLPVFGSFNWFIEDMWPNLLCWGRGYSPTLSNSTFRNFLSRTFFPKLSTQVFFSTLKFLC